MYVVYIYKLTYWYFGILAFGIEFNRSTISNKIRANTLNTWVEFISCKNNKIINNSNKIEYLDKTEYEWGLCVWGEYGESKYYENRDKNQNPIRSLTCVKWSKYMPRFFASIQILWSRIKWEIEALEEAKVWSFVTIIKWIMDTMLCTMSMNCYYKQPYGKFWYIFLQPTNFLFHS